MKLLPIHSRFGVIAHALIDDDVFAWASAHRWRLNSEGYVCRGERIAGRSRTIRLHREILGLAHGDPRQGDHVDGDKLDNRRGNLRIVTRAQNTQNRHRASRGYGYGTSGHRGVHWAKHVGAWRATARLDGRQHHLGYFADEDDAAQAAARWRESNMPYSDPRRLA